MTTPAKKADAEVAPPAGEGEVPAAGLGEAVDGETGPAGGRGAALGAAATTSSAKAAGAVKKDPFEHSQGSIFPLAGSHL